MKRGSGGGRRYLTKSRFVLAVECETKLFYAGKSAYADQKKDDPFLSALAEGGFQVGELAKLYYPGGREIQTLDHELALARTAELLQGGSAILYEAAVSHRDLFIRADILIKNGSTLELIEVKSKSFGGDPEELLDRHGAIRAGWLPYLYDVAFQKHVLALAYPKSRIRCSLLLADRNARASVDGLNQRFLIRRQDGRPRIRVREGTSREDLGDPVLVRLPVDEMVERILAGVHGTGRSRSFAAWVRFLARRYRRDRKVPTPLGSKCGRCEFRCTPEQKRSGLRSGLEECWRQQAGLREEQLAEPLVIDLWNCRRKDSFIARGIYLLRDLDPDLLLSGGLDAGGGAPRGGIAPGREEPGGGERDEAGESPGLSALDRQRLQVQKARSRDPGPYLDLPGLREEMNRWVFPLHFIDFETTAVALPFNRGMSPYEGIAFQFSHHRVDEGGRISHAGQYLHRDRGRFPNFDFLRALKKQLEGDEGTVFRYGDHENSYLNIIYSQLREADPREAPDREELIRWITTIAHPSRRNAGAWAAGRRDMVDLLGLVERYYYHPATGGSNSLKKVLPAVLGSSPFLREKYARPIYGRGLEIQSFNFESWRWVRLDENGLPLDPYRLLPPVFEDAGQEGLEHLISDTGLADGAAAMVAYARLQFSEMNERERLAVQDALLRYCELDTLAMVMLWEYWNRELMRS
jgi:hypothetical protein